jgi:dolichol-phosphate mannosyltransferase
MTSNFFLYNLFTHRDRRLRGFALVHGLFISCAIRTLGAAANVGIAGYVFSRNEVWWLAGLAGVSPTSSRVWGYDPTNIGFVAPTSLFR